MKMGQFTFKYYLITRVAAKLNMTAFIDKEVQNLYSVMDHAHFQAERTLDPDITKKDIPTEVAMAMEELERKYKEIEHENKTTTEKELSFEAARWATHMPC